MTESLKTEGEFTYAEAGEGRPLIVLHGLMGALSNFDKTFEFQNYLCTHCLCLKLTLKI
jgi:pimeloyl-ACP methyl ester carboxylesterase